MTSSLEKIVIDWMSNKGAPEWHGVAVNWNWDYGVKPLLWIVDQPDCDKATALTVFWLSEPLYEMDEKHRGDHLKDDTYKLVHRILDNWKRYRTARFSFQLPDYVQHIHSENWRLSKECLETLQPLLINIDGQERYPIYDLSIPAECYIKHKEQNGEPVTDRERDHLARERAGKNMSLTNEEVAAVQQKELEKSWSEWFDMLNDMVDTV
jgi:hypothetical protein